MLFAALHESAIGTKRTSLFAPHMSAIGGKADIRVYGRSLEPTSKRSPAEAGRSRWNLFADPQITCRLFAPIGNNLIVDRRAFIEGAQARALKRRDMHEHVLAAALRLNEAVSFCWIEPFNSTSSHSTLHRMLPPVRSPGLAI